MKIGIDLDGTMFMTYEKMQERYKARTGKEFNLELVLNVAHARNLFDRIWFFTYFRSAQNYRNLETYPDAVYSIIKLREIYETYFLTARPALPKIQEMTRESLKEYFDIPNPAQNIIFCKAEDKVQIAKNLDIKVLIEDNINSGTIPSEIRIILLKRKWNKTINNSRVELVDSWKEILDKF